jgi:hypothetical protein
VIRANTNPKLTWAKFRANWRDPTVKLQALGINVRENGNKTAEDDETFKRVRTAHTRINRESRRKLRSAGALDADAASAAMVARWRHKAGSQAGFLVAQDREIGRAYSEVFPDEKIPLTVTLTAWISLVAAMTTDDPEKLAGCAEIVRVVALRDSFLNMAAGYTYEQITTLARKLAEVPNGAPTVADVSEFVQQTFEDLEDEADDGASLAAIQLRGSRILTSRAARVNQRARRQAELADERDAAIRAEEQRSADERVAAAALDRFEAEQRLRDDLAKLASERDADREQHSADLVRRDADLERTRRTYKAGVVAAVWAVFAIGLSAAGTVGSGSGYIRLLALTAVVAALSIEYATSKKAWWALALPAIVAFAINLLTS